MDPVLKVLVLPVCQELDRTGTEFTENKTYFVEVINTEVCHCDLYHDKCYISWDWKVLVPGSVTACSSLSRKVRGVGLPAVNLICGDFNTWQSEWELENNG